MPMPTLPYTYRFKGRLAKLIILAGFVVSAFFCGVILLTAKGGFEYGVGLTVAAFLLLVVWLGSMLQTSDLILDERSIGRVVFGRRCPDIQWMNIDKIKIISIPGTTKKGEGARAYKISPRRLFGRANYLNYIVFDDKSNEIDGLLELIGYFAEKNQIKVECAEIDYRISRRS